MDSPQQRQQIINSLKTVVSILKDCNSEYRIIGSVLIVAYKKQVFRKIADIDILLDKQSRDCVFNQLWSEGFTLKKRRWANFSWTEAEKENYTGLTFFLVGEFTPDYFSYKFSKLFELRINSDYLKPAKYSFAGVEFIGIPLSSHIAGIKQAFLNPKRSLDKQILAKEMKNNNQNTYNNIVVYIAGVKIPYLYDLFSFFYNIYGGLRISFGQKWEAWE